MEGFSKGDILKFPRGCFHHFGIYIGDRKMIHRWGGQGGPSTASDSFLSFSGVINGKASIRIDKVKDVVGKSRLVKVANSLDNKLKRGMPFSPDQIVERAMSKLGEKGYNVVNQNCEHFVNWCRYGLEYSEQVDGRFQFFVLCVDFLSGIPSGFLF